VKGELATSQVAEAAGQVPVEPFVPRKGVQIETDPKATSVSKASALGDDEGVINALVERLEVRHARSLQ
jgi:ubiquitin-activating enzyme E1